MKYDVAPTATNVSTNVPIASARIMLIRLPGKLVSKRALLVVADALTVLVTVVFVVVAAAFFGVDLAAATFFVVLFVAIVPPYKY